jgi:hypothetical protein
MEFFMPFKIGFFNSSSSFLVVGFPLFSHFLALHFLFSDAEFVQKAF